MHTWNCYHIKRLHNNTTLARQKYLHACQYLVVQKSADFLVQHTMLILQIQVEHMYGPCLSEVHHTDFSSFNSTPAFMATGSHIPYTF